MKQSLVLALAYSTSALNYGKCFYGSGFKGRVNGYNSAIDPEYANGSDCSGAVTNYLAAIDYINDQFENFEIDSWTAPLEATIDFPIEYTNVATACNYVVISQQLHPRLSTLAGFFNFLSTFLIGFLAYTPLFSQGIDRLLDCDTCEEFGAAWGATVRYAVVFESPDEVFYNDVIEGSVNIVVN